MNVKEFLQLAKCGGKLMKGVVLLNEDKVEAALAEADRIHVRIGIRTGKDKGNSTPTPS